MSAKPRFMVPDIPYHITARANKGAFILEAEKHKKVYAEMIEENADKYGVKIYAWCLMGNHVHFIMEPKNELAMAQTFKITQQRFSRFINRGFKSYGPNWQRRYYSSPLDDKHLYHAIRYVELNPVRAKVTSDIDIYPWSSASARFGQESEIALSSFDRHIEIDNWVDYYNEQSDEKIIENIRVNTNLNMPSGGPTFVNVMEMLKEQMLRGMHAENHNPLKIRL